MIKKTKAEDKKEMQSLRRKCFHLWAAKVRQNAGNQCEAWEDGKRCDKTTFLNAHHIESFATNKDLRYDPKNGFCACPSHHKFKRKSAHKSFIFMYLHMITHRSDDLKYLIEATEVIQPQTKESLLEIINKLSPKPQLLRRVR
jgi:hypothetical protein